MIWAYITNAIKAYSNGDIIIIIIIIIIGFLV